MSELPASSSTAATSSLLRGENSTPLLDLGQKTVTGQKLFLGLVERYSGQQFRPSGQGPAHRRQQPPIPDGGMISAQQNLWHLQPHKLARPGVLGMFEQAAAEGILAGRLGATQHPGQEPGHRIEQYQGRQLAAGQDVIADGDFFVDQEFDHPFIHALVTTAEQDQMRPGGQFVGQLLVKGRP